MSVIEPPKESEVKQAVKLLGNNHFLSNWVRYHWERSDMPLVFSLLTGLQVIESIAGDLSLEMFDETRKTNLFTFLIAGSGAGRKSWAIGRGLAMIEEVKRGLGEKADDRPVSPFGLHKKPPTYQGARLAVKETDPEQGRILFYYPEGQEFFEMAKADPNYQAFYMDAYDGGRISDYTKTKTSRVLLEQSRVSLLVGATVSHVEGYMSREDWIRGFAGRCLWGYGLQERRKPYSARPGARAGEAWTRAKKAAVRAGKEAKTGTPWPSPEAGAVVSTWRDEHPIFKGLSEDQSDLVARTAHQALTISRLISWVENRDVEARHARVATAIMTLCVRSMLALQQRSPNSPRDADYRIVLNSLDELAAIEVTTTGLVVEGKKVPKFSFDEVYLQVAKMKRLHPEYLSALLDEASISGIVAWGDAERTILKYKGPRRRVLVSRGA